MNILIKLMSIVSLVIAPYIAVNGGEAGMEKCSSDKMECGTSMMSCDKDADGNCIIDSTMCESWIQAGMIDKTACVKMENGKCHMKSDACKNAMMECHKGMEGCKEGDMKGCESKMKDCGDMSKEECQEKMGGEKECCKKK